MRAHLEADDLHAALLGPEGDRPRVGLRRLGAGTADPERARERDRGCDGQCRRERTRPGSDPPPGVRGGARDGRSPDRSWHAFVKRS